MASATTQNAHGSNMRHHALSNVQTIPTATEPAIQDAFFTQLQFDKGITSMLAIAGFDGVTASALHSFKALAEEFIVDFLETVGMSMLASRRTAPIPQDFILALAEAGITPSQLEEQIKLRIPKDVSAPHIVGPRPDERPPLDLSRMLGPALVEISNHDRPQIPGHFPPLPSKHTWSVTEPTAEREKDPRKIRELAAKEGIVAEQGLRRLAAAANKPRSKLHRTTSTAEKTRRAIWQDAVAALSEDALHTQHDGDVDMMDGANDDPTASKDDGKQPGKSAMVINYDRAYWRKGASFGSMLG